MESIYSSLVIALDVAGAFNRVWQRGLLTKLEQLDVTGRLPELFSNYLYGQSLRVVVIECTSVTYLVEASVPHGSI